MTPTDELTNLRVLLAESEKIYVERGEEITRLRAEVQRYVDAAMERNDALEGPMGALEAENERLKTALGEAVSRRRLAEASDQCRVETICSELGGLVEGRPTASINYLQRVRELRRIEDRCEEVDWHIVLLEGARVTGADQKLSLYNMRPMVAAIRAALTPREPAAGEVEFIVDSQFPEPQPPAPQKVEGPIKLPVTFRAYDDERPSLHDADGRDIACIENWAAARQIAAALNAQPAAASLAGLIAAKAAEFRPEHPELWSADRCRHGKRIVDGHTEPHGGCEFPPFEQPAAGGVTDTERMELHLLRSLEAVAMEWLDEDPEPDDGPGPELRSIRDQLAAIRLRGERDGD